MEGCNVVKGKKTGDNVHRLEVVRRAWSDMDELTSEESEWKAKDGGRGGRGNGAEGRGRTEGRDVTRRSAEGGMLVSGL